jgi:hypothetical protein
LSRGVKHILVTGMTVTMLLASGASASAQNIFEALFGRLASTLVHVELIVFLIGAGGGIAIGGAIAGTILMHQPKYWLTCVRLPRRLHRRLRRSARANYRTFKEELIERLTHSLEEHPALYAD